MDQFVSFRDREGNHHVCKSKALKSDARNKNEHLVDDIPVSVLCFNNDRKTLENLCINLNSKSPKIKLVDSNRHKKPVVRENKIMKTASLPPKQLIFNNYENPKDDFQEIPEEESEYEPTDSESDTESEASDPEPDININNNISVSSGVFDVTFDTPEKLQSSFNVPGNSACDDENLKTDSSKSKISKKNLCFYCKKLQSQLARHLEMKHAQEDLVKEFLSYGKNSQERKNAIAVIRKKGNFELFVDKDLNKDEKFVPARRPVDAKNCSASYYAVCPDCKGVYTKNNLRHHIAQCPMQKNGSRGVMAKSRAAVGRIHHRADEVLRQEVIPRMSEDDVVRSIRYDLAIIICGNELCLRHRKEYRHKLIRANLRLCGRFLLFLQRKDPKITDFAAIYNPVYYHFIIKSIDEFAGINRRTGHYKTAGNATELTKHIKVIGELLKGEYIMSKEAEKKSNVDNFLTLCNTGFGNVINKTAMETLVARQRQRVVELPISNDILKISEYLDKVIDKHYNELKKGFSHLAWRKLSEAILSRMQVFNRRRAGESERLEITDMKSITAIKPDDEDYDTLTAEEKNSANEYMRVVIRGKLNSNVPIVLKKHWYSAIKLIVKYREQAGVSPENPYVFGIKGSSDQSFLVATKLLNMFSKECGAAKPALLRGTPLRKHAATKCAQLGLDDAKTAHFAKFMGHNINIHKYIYQQPVLKKDILGISKVLERAQKPSSTVTSGALENDASLNNQDSSFDKNNRTFESLPETENEPEETNSASMEISPSDDDENSTSQPRSSFGDQNYGYNHDTKKSPVVSRVPWTNEEIKNVQHYFKRYFQTKTLPPLATIRNIQSQHGILKNRTPVVIKAYINNQNNKQKPFKDFDNKHTSDKQSYNRIIKHLNFTFKDYIIKKKIPALDVCTLAKKSDKVLNTLSEIKIQKLIRKLIHNNERY